MRLTKRQIKRIIREEKQKLQELDFSGPAVGTDDHPYGDDPDNPLLNLEYMVANEVEELIMSILEDHSLEGEGITMDELNMAIARGIDRAKAILRY